MNDKEKRIKEERTIEATRKGLMGSGGKFGTIVKHLGQPITVHSKGGLYFDSNYLEDPWELPGEGDPWELQEGTAEEVQKQIPYMGMENDPNSIGDPVTLTNIGWHFDGLNRGIHLEIKYESEKSELTVHYKGYTVYREIANELMAYAPFDEWEDKINQLFKVAREKQIHTLKTDKEERIESAKNAKENWWQRVREKWGL